MTVIPVDERRRPQVNRTVTGDVPGSASITTQMLAGVSLVRLRGDIELHDLTALSAAFASALAVHSWVIVDLSRVRIINPVAFSVLVKAGFVARSKGGDLLVAAPTGFLRSARLATTFSAYDTLPQALTAALRQRSSALVSRTPHQAAWR